MKAIGTNLQHARDDDGRNRGTRIATVTPAPATDLGALFRETYATFAPRCREVVGPGLAIVAIEERTRRTAGVSVLRAQPGRHVAAIVGRHDHCDLSLCASDELPLRQLAVILDPVTSWAAGRAGGDYRILDLRTPRGFVDEHGRALRGLRCDGPAVLRCAGHAIYVLPLGDPTDWPASGADAWAFQPERIYFDERTHHARGSSSATPRFAADAVPRTRITAIRGPREPSAGLVADGDLIGTLELVGPDRHDTLPIGSAALRDGVLLGRYARCDRMLGDDASISRVHALLIQLGDELLVIDTASTNGTARPAAEPARVHALGGEAELRLGFETRARWRWLS